MSASAAPDGSEMEERLHGGVMRTKALMVAVLVGVFASTGCDTDVLMYGSNPEVKRAEQRVSAVLDGMQTGGDGIGEDLQLSICKWYTGAAFIGGEKSLDTAWLEFDDWRQAKGLYNKKIGSYEIVESSLVDGSDPVEVTMTLMIDGRQHRILVPEGVPIRWLN